MTVHSLPLSKPLLVLLPNEIFFDIISTFDHWTIKRLSTVCKRLRTQCLPYLFRDIHVSFTPHGLLALRGLSQSDEICQHVVWVTYSVTDILDPRVADAQKLREELYTSRAYAEDETEHYYLKNGNMKTFPAYESILEAFLPVGASQRNVLGKSLDMDVVSSALCRFPKVSKVTLRYDMPPIVPKFIPMLLSLRIKPEESLRHHLKVLAGGIRQTRDCSITIRTVEFGGSSKAWGSVNIDTSAELLRDILEDVEVLRLFRANAILTGAYQLPPFGHLREIDMCDFPVIDRPAFQKFVKGHLNTLRAIHWHKVSVNSDFLRRVTQHPNVSQTVIFQPCVFRQRVGVDKLLLTRIT
ncbi:hypothetical protein AJ79_09256 [Helicocarpus griseus UAMH5409]|uniref:F-box domain-containing protein n=1 Tax=Helicocarpus griseus UAMH5409 TaxID=1447875 RepID=A0A2B7WL03_9EURO|nr:hypothetical protein AJ79_09256 [Helicocarpus griseus UAMH5409]